MGLFLLIVLRLENVLVKPSIMDLLLIDQSAIGSINQFHLLVEWQVRFEVLSYH